MVRFKLKSQSAVEYLITYGWAIVTISVVLGALYQLGFFSGTNFITTECLAQSGFTCQQPVMNSTGYVEVNFGQLSNGTMTLTGTGCSNSTTQPTISSSFQPNFTATLLLIPGQKYSAVFQCPGAVTGGRIGVPFRGYLWIKYNFGSQTGIIAQIATISAVSSTPVSFIALKPSTIYCLGGQVSPTYDYYASTGGGSFAVYIGPWSSGTALPSGPNDDLGCVAYGGYVYCEGTGSNYNGVVSAPIATGGGITGSWTTGANSYPPATTPYGTSCAQSSGTLFCVGGNGYNSVYSAPLSSGVIGAWTSGTSLPFSGYFNQGYCGIYSGYMYCVGGVFGGVGSNAIYYIKVTSSGFSGSWAASGNYPTTVASSLYNQGCAIYNGYMYCIGGSPAGVGNVAYYASLSSAGIGSWSSTTSYPPSGQNDQQGCYATNGYMYCAGGEPGAQSYTYFAAVSSTGIGTWQTGNSMPTADRSTSSDWCVIAQNP